MDPNLEPEQGVGFGVGTKPNFADVSLSKLNKKFSLTEYDFLSYFPKNDVVFLGYNYYRRNGREFWRSKKGANRDRR